MKTKFVKQFLLSLIILAASNLYRSKSYAQSQNFYFHMNAYKSDPALARSACQSMRNINRLNESVYTSEALYYSANTLQVTPQEAKAIQVWLAGNHCPDVW